MDLTRLSFVLFCSVFFKERPFLLSYFHSWCSDTLCVVGRRMLCAFRSLSCMCDLPHHGTQTDTQETLPPAREENFSLCGLHAIIVACRGVKKTPVEPSSQWIYFILFYYFFPLQPWTRGPATLDKQITTWDGTSEQDELCLSWPPKNSSQCGRSRCLLCRTSRNVFTPL